MLEKELKDIWRNSSQAEQIKFDLSKLMIELNAKLHHIEKAIHKRDWIETAASSVGIIFFSYLAYEIPFLLSKTACLFGVFWFGYVIYRLWNVKKNGKSDFSQSFKEVLKSEKDHLLKQAHLLNTVLYWYVLPPFLLNTLFVIGLGDPAVYSWSNFLTDLLLPFSTMEKVGILVGLSFFYAFIVWMNKRAVKKEIDPLVAEIDKVQKQMDLDNVAN